jgi:hypothetical protein
MRTSAAEATRQVASGMEAAITERRDRYIGESLGAVVLAEMGEWLRS